MPFILRKTVSETFLERVKTTPNVAAFKSKSHGKAGAWTPVTFRGFHDECRLVSLGLMSLGIEPGDAVGLVSSPRYEWTLSDIAILGARAVTVPVYPSNTPADVQYILEHSDAKIAFLED